MSCTASLTSREQPWQAMPVTIADIRLETPGVATYQLALQDPVAAASYRFEPGQFNMVYLPGVGESAISISAPIRDGLIAHTIREAGNVTRALAQLDIGDSIAIRGPFGSSWPLDDCAGRDVVIVAGGIGLAPLRPVIHDMLEHPDHYGQKTVLVGGRSPEHLLFQMEYDQWKSGGISLETTVDRSVPGWEGNVGVVPVMLDRLSIRTPNHTVVFVCGPEVMMWYAVRSALNKLIPPENIWINTERNMNCAVGLCGHCQFGPEFICKDGPILRYDWLFPWMKVKGL